MRLLKTFINKFFKKPTIVINTGGLPPPIIGGLNQLPCYYAINGIDYKNGNATVCPTQSDYLYVYKDKSVLPSDIINSEKFVEIRKELINGNWPEGCHLCEQQERDGTVSSMRHDYIDNPRRTPVEKYLNHFTGELDFKGLQFIELRFSNSCNMACLHCSKVYSSGWVTKLKHYTPTKKDFNHNLDQITSKMHMPNYLADQDLNIELLQSDADKIVDDLIINFPNINDVAFAGGEVLHQKQFLPCLHRLAKHPNANNMQIAFHTNFNANFDPVELSDALQPFGGSLIHMSIDAGKNIYPYFRDGSWEKLTDNIAKFREVNSFTNLFSVCTTSAYQLMDIENVFVSLLSLNLNEFSIAMVNTPWYINPAVLMLNHKKDVLHDIENTFTAIDNTIADADRKIEAKKALKQIITYIANYQPDARFLRTYPNGMDDAYNAFIYYIKASDRLWKQNFNDYYTNYQFTGKDLIRINK